MSIVVAADMRKVAIKARMLRPVSFTGIANTAYGLSSQPQLLEIGGTGRNE